jgi:chloramphenicol-sensitive protein RarD
VTAGLICNLLWGTTPLLFMQLARMGAGSWEIVAQRAMWSVPCAALLVLLAGQRAEVGRILRDPRSLGLLALSGISIATGWSLYVWAVDDHRNLEASLGYYITPLMNMAAGWVLFRERIDRFGVAAVALAAIGVAVQAAALGRLPIVSLVLATTFWIYGLVRRHVQVSAQAGLLVECLVIAAPGVAYVAWLAASGQGVFGRHLDVSLLLPLVGPVTVTPLAIFAWTARRLPFSTLGFLQFVSPTVGFFIGLATGEPLTPLRLASFVFIWAGATAFALGAWRAGRRASATDFGDGLDQGLDGRLAADGPHGLEVGQGVGGGVVELPVAADEAAVGELRGLPAAVDHPAVAELAVGKQPGVEGDGLVIEGGGAMHG